MVGTNFFQSLEQRLPGGRKFLFLMSTLFIVFLVTIVLVLGLNLFLLARIENEHKRRFDSLDSQLQGLQTSMDTLAVSMEDAFREQKEDMKTNSIFLEEAITRNSNRVINNIVAADRHIGRIEQVYSNLLEEQKKKTLESLYDEKELLDMLHAAQDSFKAEKYRQAYGQYVMVASEMPENMEVQFYKFYSLFLINKGDQNQYRQIKNAFLDIEKRGYSRPEIKEVLDFIAKEEQ
jgi:hypothetical protein